MHQEALFSMMRRRPLFTEDLRHHNDEINERIGASAFLVIGGAGSIGQAVVKEIFSRSPRRLDVVDLSENNLVELVRDLRSSIGYISGGFRTLALDASSLEFEIFLRSAPPYDYVLNLAALKHVRSERDPFTLMRLIATNVLMTSSTLDLAIERSARHYFGVSSDKAVNSANAMGASKRAMELCLVARADRIATTSTRFANVAFSDGSLLHGFRERLAKRQPLSAPEDVRRYFITAQEAGRLCLLACLVAGSCESFFPNPASDFDPLSFRQLAEGYLDWNDLEAFPCNSEDEARSRVEELASQGRWPCYFFTSDTTGEKPVEEFYSCREHPDLSRFREIGVVNLQREPAISSASERIDAFMQSVDQLRGSRGGWSREDILDLLKQLVPEFAHRETGRHLDGRM